MGRYCAHSEWSIHAQICLLIRPPDILVGGLRHTCRCYRDSIFFFYLLLFSLSTLRARWTQMRFKNIGPLCQKSGVYPPSTNRGPQNLFSTTLQLNGNFNGLYLRNETWRASALETTRGLLHRLKMSWHLVHKRLKIGPSFLRTNGLKYDWSFYPPWVFFRSQSVAHAVSSINVPPHSGSKWNSIGFSAAQIRSPEKI